MRTGLIALSLLLQTGISAARADIAPEDCRFGSLDGIRTECAYLTVPESRAGNNDIQLRLPYVIFPAASRTALPPVIILNGGPGGLIDIHSEKGIKSWIKYVKGFQKAGAGDVILFTQRGTDNEQAGMLACEALQGPETSIGASRTKNRKRDWRHLFRTTLAECRDAALAAGHDLMAYSTRESVKDVVALKQALNIKNWIIYGVSYGSRLALEIARHDATGIDALILDSPSAPGATRHFQETAVLINSLNSLGDICRKIWRCRALSRNVYEDTLARLARLGKKPLMLTLRSPDDNQEYYLEMGDAMFSQLLFLAFYHPTTIAAIPNVLAKLRLGNQRPLKRLASHLLLKKQAIRIGTYASVACQDDNPELQVTSLQAELMHLQEFQAAIRDRIWLNETLCRDWFQDWTPPAWPGPVKTSVRTLVLAGALDPVTPVQTAEFLGATLPNATVRIYPDASHGILEFLPCAWTDVANFLQKKPMANSGFCQRHYSFQG